MVKSLDFDQQPSKKHSSKKQRYGSRQHKHLLKELPQKIYFQKSSLKTDIFKIVSQESKQTKTWSQTCYFKREFLKFLPQKRYFENFYFI